jgi:tRNA (cytidine/uridine-2'-O-)-methyltransferase
MNHIILFHPEIPQNTGNIMRTAMATNCHLHIIGPTPFLINEQTLKRTGLDYIEHLKWTYYESYEAFNKTHLHPPIYCITRYSHQVFSEASFSDVHQDYFIMFGAESSGIDPFILKEHQQRLLRIPMVPLARSLNVSNAVAIVIYEVLRQQKYHQLSTFEAIKGKDYIDKKIG